MYLIQSYFFVKITTPLFIFILLIFLNVTIQENFIDFILVYINKQMRSKIAGSLNSRLFPSRFTNNQIEIESTWREKLFVSFTVGSNYAECPTVTRHFLLKFRNRFEDDFSGETETRSIQKEEFHLTYRQMEYFCLSRSSLILRYTWRDSELIRPSIVIKSRRDCRRRRIVSDL